MWKTAIVNRHIVRLKVIAVLLLYTLATASVINAGVVKRDIGDAAVVTIAGNGTTETPATSAAAIGNVGVYKIGSDHPHDKTTLNGTGETNGNAIAVNDHKSNDLNDKSLHQHVLNHEDEFINFDEPDDALVERSGHK